MKILIDVMSGDNAPLQPLLAAYRAATESDVHFVLLGDENELQQLAQQHALDLERDNITLIPTASRVEMDDPPLCTVQNKTDSSMAQGLRMLAAGEGDAFVCAGNSGALIAGATLTVRRIRGIQRCAIGALLPLEKPVLLVDAGANTAVTAEQLLQFAHMGSIYLQGMYGVTNPTVGLVNNGVEENKGAAEYRKAYALLRDCADLSFYGNVEGLQIPFAPCDVLVCDGFCGNVILKLLEGIGAWLRTQLQPHSSFEKWCVPPRYRQIAAQWNSSRQGGAPLLGISRPIIKVHGNCDSDAFYHAIRQSISLVNADVIPKIASFSLRTVEANP